MSARNHPKNRSNRRGNDVKSVVDKIQKLPTLPKIGLSILDLADDPEISMEDMSRLMQHDPSLAARVLKVANSPFYGMPRQVDSLQLALVILGLCEVRNIALGIMILKIMSGLDTHITYDRDKFWTHSTGCGIAARILGRKLNMRSEGADFIVGLLHDMGKIILDEYFCEQFARIFERMTATGAPMVKAEREIIGESHEQVGGWLAEKWRLPETLCEAITYHHRFPELQEGPALKDPKTVALAYITEAFCDQYMIGWDGDSGCNDIRNEQAWEILLSGQSTYSAGDIGVILDETKQEFNDAPLHVLK